MACKRSPVRSRYSPPEQGITHCVVSFLFVRNFCLSQTSEALAQPEERRAWTARVHRDLKRPGILRQKEKHRTAMCGAFLFVWNFCLSQTSEASAQPEERRAWTARVHRDLKRPGILHQKEKHCTAMCGVFLFVLVLHTHSNPHSSRSNRPIITGIETMESSVVSTYNALECAASRSYSWAMEVTVAQAGVMAAR